MAATIHVKEIDSKTTEKEVRDFFSFCGKISQLSITNETNDPNSTKTAAVTFEKDTAAKTALLLDNTQLGTSIVKVSSAASLDELAGNKPSDGSARTSNEPDQEDKPRSRIIAEYLAHGYILSDKVIEKALDLDRNSKLSDRFKETLLQLDNKFRASQHLHAVDQQYDLTARATAGINFLGSYFEAATQTPTGRRLREFYETGQKQVVDVHNEAKHLASLKTGKSDNGLHPSGETSVTAEQAEMEKVNIDGQVKTKCNCGGADGKCPCEPGQCACSGCSKAS